MEMGGYNCKFIGGSKHGETEWLPELWPIFRCHEPTTQADVSAMIGMMKRGESIPEQEPDFCEYELVSFSSENHFVYLAIESEDG